MTLKINNNYYLPAVVLSSEVQAETFLSFCLLQQTPQSVFTSQQFKAAPVGLPVPYLTAESQECCSAQNTAGEFPVVNIKTSVQQFQRVPSAAGEAKLKVWFSLVSRDISSSLTPPFFGGFS